MAPPTGPSQLRVALGGAGFGLTSGVLTTLGLLVGLSAGTGSRSAVAAGIATIAIADALSDALGMHVSQESAGHDRTSARTGALSTFAAKLVIALTFLVPVLLLPLGIAVLVSIGWGAALLAAFSWYLAGLNQRSRGRGIAWNLLMAGAVLSASQAVGMLINRWTD